jgi:hypothetical protein
MAITNTALRERLIKALFLLNDFPPKKERNQALSDGLHAIETILADSYGIDSASYELNRASLRAVLAEQFIFSPVSGGGCTGRLVAA